MPPRGSDSLGGRAVSGPIIKVKKASGKRNLRRAVLLLTQKLEGLGVDCSDVTEMLGSDDE